MGRLTTKTWDEAAFISRALPELTDAMGLHLILNDLDRYCDLDAEISADTSYLSVMDPDAVARLRTAWIARANTHFPVAWHGAIAERVASTEHFRLSLVHHLDQVRFAIRTPRWITVTQGAALASGLLAIIALVLGLAPFPSLFTAALLAAAQFLPLAAAGLGIISIVGRGKFRAARVAYVSNCVRQELRAAIAHAFGHPISDAAAGLALESELQLG